MSAPSVRELLDRLSVSPVRLRALLSSLPEAVLRSKPLGGGFAPIEDAWHLRDIEVEGHYVRVRRTLAEEHPVLPPINGEELALARNYLGRELGAALDEFAQYREASLDLLGKLTDNAWLRSAQFEGKSVTLRELVGAIAAHDEAHLVALTSELDAPTVGLEEGHRADPELTDDPVVGGVSRR